jgi:hypothetical protein
MRTKWTKGAAVTEFDTEDDLKALAEAFLERTLPGTAWRHDAHCVVTAYLLLRRRDMDLPIELPGLIRRYNEATGGKNTDSSGYHHSITLFYLGAIRDFMTTQDTRNLVQACRKSLASPLGDKDFPLSYYSREVLFTPTARLGWVAPDLKAFDIDDLA